MSTDSIQKMKYKGSETYKELLQLTKRNEDKTTLR